MVLSCLGVVGGHRVRATKVLIVSDPIAIFHAGMENPNWLVEIRVCKLLYSYSLLTQLLTYICRVFILINIFSALFGFAFVITSTRLF